MQYGFYSARAAKLFGTIIYLDQNGKEVEITAIADDTAALHYKWKDKVCVGPLGKYLRPGKSPDFPFVPHEAPRQDRHRF